MVSMYKQTHTYNKQKICKATVALISIIGLKVQFFNQQLQFLPPSDKTSDVLGFSLGGVIKTIPQRFES